MFRQLRLLQTPRRTTRRSCGDDHAVLSHCSPGLAATPTSPSWVGTDGAAGRPPVSKRNKLDVFFILFESENTINASIDILPQSSRFYKAQTTHLQKKVASAVETASPRDWRAGSGRLWAR